MSNSHSVYKFKPFQFTALEKKKQHPSQKPLAKSGRHVVCNNAYLFSYGGSNPQTADRYGHRESWKFCFDLGEWKRIACKDVPQELASSSVTLSGNMVIIYGGSGFLLEPFYSNRMYVGNLADEFKEVGMKFEELRVSGDVPRPLYEQGVVLDGKYIYSIGGTCDHDNELDVHRLDLSNKKWELVHKSENKFPEPGSIFRHEVVFYKSGIYSFSGGRGGAGQDDAINTFYEFSTIHMFDVTARKWKYVPAKPDHKVPAPGYPENRNCHSCVQCPENPNLVYICGGMSWLQSNSRAFGDVWRFDLENLQWENLTWCTLPQQLYLHSAAVTPSGRMCFYGGIIYKENIEESEGHSNNVLGAWITIPKLKAISWEAMLFYFKDQMFESSDEHLKKIGLPLEYCEQIIEARRPNNVRK